MDGKRSMRNKPWIWNGGGGERVFSDSARETMAEKRGTCGGGRGRYEGDHGGDDAELERLLKMQRRGEGGASKEKRRWDAKPERLRKMQRRGEGGANKEKKRRGILYYQTHMYFYKIDLDQFDGIDFEVKSLAPSVDFVESGQFIGMGLCKIGERVFVFGGQTPVKTNLPTFEKTHYNAGVTEFLPHEDKFVNQNLIPPMNGPKARPLVVCFKDNIFVHDRYPAVYRCRPLNNCLFQRLSLSPASSWENLHSPMVMGRYTGLRTSVVGERLFLLDPLGKHVFCFNLETGKWEPDSSSSMVSSCRKNDLRVPIGGTHVFRLPSGANILLYASQVRACVQLYDYSTAEGTPCRLRAYVMDESSGGQLLAFQSLPQFDPFLRSLLYERARPIFLDLGDGSMCGLFFGRNRITRRGHYLNVSIFSMKKLVADEAIDRWRKNPPLNSEEETEILQCKILHSQSFELEEESEAKYLTEGGHETHGAFVA